MRQYFAAIAIALTLLLPGLSMAQATPDEVVKDVEEKLLGDTAKLSESAAQIAVLLRMEILVKDERLSRSGSLILRKDKEIPGVGSFHEYWKIDKHPSYPDGSHLNVRPLTDAERNNLMVAHGTTTQALGTALEESATGIAIAGAAMDAEIAKSGIGGKLFDGANGAMMLGTMLSPQSQSKDGDSGCTQMLGEEGRKLTGKSYSDTYAIGVSPYTGKFSASLFLAGGACMFQEFGQYLKNASDSTDDFEQKFQDLVMSSAIEAATSLEWHGLEGPENDKQAHIAMSDVGLTQETGDGGSMTIDQIHLWIDDDAYVRTKMKFIGVMHADGKSQDFSMENQWYDFEHVPGTALYEPYREIMLFGGQVSEADKAKMAEAEKQLAEFEKQLADMPASQRAMLEKMVGPQIQQYRALVNGGSIQFQAVTTDIVVNPQMVDPDNTIMAVVDQDNTERLIRRIQQDLTTLGYETDVINGVLTEQTVAAIGAFETRMGMPVTGAATQELADILGAEVSKKN